MSENKLAKVLKFITKVSDQKLDEVLAALEDEATDELSSSK